LKPIFRDDAKARANGELPCPHKVPVPEIPAAKGAHVIASKCWVGFKHFVYGFSLAATASLVAGAHPYLAVGLGIAGGVAEATRKTVKDVRAESGDAWPDMLDRLLKIIIAIVEALKSRKGGKA